jgi:sulfur-oxidizing protein SoxY
MSMKRRLFLKRTATASVVGAALSAGLLQPRAVLAAWPKSAFKADDVNAALTELFGMADVADSADISLKAPDIAENGAVVPITVTTSLPNVESIAIVVENNPSPLAASFNLGSNAGGYVSTRIKMGKTSNVLAVVKSGGKLYKGTKEVKVTIGGCGG